MKTGKTYISILLALLVVLCQVSASDGWQDQDRVRARLSLDYYNLNNTDHQIIATVRTRGGRDASGTFIGPEPVSGVSVRFFMDFDSVSLSLGAIDTDEDGKAIVNLDEQSRKVLDTLTTWTFRALVENSEKITDVDNDLVIQKAITDITTEEVDSARTLMFFVGAPDSSGQVVPVEGVLCRIYVQRLFGELPISEEFATTDGEGIFELQFPSGIPGNETGELTVIGKVEDHDEFGNLVYRTILPWGTNVEYSSQVVEEELFSSSANISNWAVVVITCMVAAILGVILYVILQLFKIKRMGFHKIE